MAIPEILEGLQIRLVFWKIIFNHIDINMFPHEIKLKFLYQQVKQTYKIEKQSKTFVQIWKSANSIFFQRFLWLLCALKLKNF